KFLGRRHTAADPAALQPGAPPLSGTSGAVLDPVFALRHTVRLEPGTSATVAFRTGFADTREEALALADEFHTVHAVTRAFELAWAHSRVELRHLSVSVEDAHLFQRLAGYMMFAGPVLRAPQALAANTFGQMALWRHGISGDHLILLARVD